MTLVERQFFALLRAGLTGARPDLSLFAGQVDWGGIYTLADQQAVVPLVTDGIDLFPEDVKPSIEVLEPFLADVLATEMRNDAMDRFAASLFRRLNSIVPVLMVKGQGLARLYPVPNHRQPGDIDLLVRPDDYTRTRDFLLSKARTSDEEHPEIMHQGMSFGSIEVEIHGTVSTLMSVHLDRKLAALLEKVFSDEDFVVESFDGIPVKTPGPRFNAVYILVHFLHHYWSSGVGLRQLIDWGLYLNRYFEDLDQERLGAVLKDLGIFRLWQTFAGFTVTFLGIDKDRVPFYSDRYRRKYAGILRYILKSGNFGRNQGPRSPKPKNYLTRKITSFWRLVVCDRLRHFPEFPRESLRYFLGATHYGLIRLSEGE